MDSIEVFAKIKVETFQELGGWVARSAALRLSANGTSRDEAFKNLQEVVEQFFLSCAERGNLFEVLRTRRVQHHTTTGSEESPQEMTIPVPLLVQADARRQAH